MPKYTLLHGGLTIKKQHYPAGSEIELEVAEAAKINKRGEHLKLSALLKVEAEAEKKKADIIAAAEKKLQAEIEAETKKHIEKTEKLAKGGES